MTGEKGGLLAGLRAEALKSRHAAPVRLAVLMALPMPLLGAMPYRGVQIFGAWNYWYALFLPVALSLVVACVARADARTRMRGLLGLGFPLGRAWWAKALWCLALCTLSNLAVFGIYLAGSAFSSQGLTAAGTLTMLLCALANTVTAAWMIPAGLFLTARLGMLAGIFCPLAAQLVGGFAWSLVPLPWIGYTDVDSSGRGAGDGRAVYEGPQAPEAFHRRVQEADSRPLQRRQAQARDHGRVRPRQEHRGEVDQVDKRDRLAARRGQPHARAEPDPGARAREPQAPDGGRRLKTSGADMRSKVRAIAANEGRYPISAQCRLLGVARSTYYSMRSRADRPAAPDPAAPAVVAAHAASKGRYGSRKIKASPGRSGVTVSRRRVCRIMRENGLVSAYGRKRFKVHPGAVNEADVPNVVARGFGGRAPRTHICSDLTYVRVGASWNYVCLLVDPCNREIVGHSAGPRKDARPVKSAFAALSFPISDIEVFHTDRGSEFDNAEIDLMLEAFGIERSLSAKGCPYDNAVDESTNRILKAELVHRETFGTTRELRAKLSDYVHRYDNFRIHSTLGYMSPVEFREAGLSLPKSSK